MNSDLSSRPHCTINFIFWHLPLLTCSFSYPLRMPFQSKVPQTLLTFLIVNQILDQESLKGRRLLVSFVWLWLTVHYSPSWQGRHGSGWSHYICSQKSTKSGASLWTLCPHQTTSSSIFHSEALQFHTPSNWKSLFSKLKHLHGGCFKVWILESVISYSLVCRKSATRSYWHHFSTFGWGHYCPVPTLWVELEPDFEGSSNSLSYLRPGRNTASITGPYCHNHQEMTRKEWAPLSSHCPKHSNYQISHALPRFKTKNYTKGLWDPSYLQRLWFQVEEDDE